MIEAPGALSDQQMLDACDAFAVGLERYFLDLDDNGRDEISYYAAVAISIAAELSGRPGAGLSLDRALSLRRSQQWVEMYRRRYSKYAPLLIENFNSLEPTATLGDTLDRYVVGSPGGRQRALAVATFTLVAHDLLSG